MKKHIISGAMLTAIIMLFLTGISCSSPVNTVQDPHFTEDGQLIKDSTDTVSFEPIMPKRIKFYVEVSGSMNGFFRANRPTAFKRDLWQIMTYCSAIAPTVSILTNDGASGAEMPQSQFQAYMNTGAFISSASTKVPVMLQGIISALNTTAGEVAVLVSDMKYSPVGAAAPEVLLTQYSSDINRILGTAGKAVSMVCATSDYLDNAGNDIAANHSPYYYLIIGDAMQVADVRNTISSLLQENGSFIDNIESGFDYGSPAYSFGIPRNCDQLDEEPTFINCSDDPNMPCTVRLKVALQNYRWLLSDSTELRKAFKVKAQYGSTVEVGDISIETKNITDNTLRRTSTATVELIVSNMPLESEVLEWTMELPNTDISKMSPFFTNATSENDPTKSFSVLDFIKGIFHGGIINENLKPNYILLSKKG